MNPILIGTSAFPTADPIRLREAGFEWVRHDFPFPFQDRLGGELAPDYLNAREEARQWAAKGFKIMGVTPLIGIGGYQPGADGKLQFTWKDMLPRWMGTPNSDTLTQRYQEVCAFLAQDLRDVVQMWQINNELNIPLFAGPLNPYNACELILQAAIGLKESDPSLIVGPNSALSPLRYYFYGRLYGDPRAKYLDYVGIDGYLGTWDGGGPEDWNVLLAELSDLTRAPILVNEWGYSSAGGVMTSEENKPGVLVCQYKKWQYAWGGGHTPQTQGDFVRRAMEAFYYQRDSLLGAFFYRWEDQERCWQCGEADCPAETAWGLVDRKGSPKPAFYAHKEGVDKLKNG